MYSSSKNPFFRSAFTHIKRAVNPPTPILLLVNLLLLPRKEIGADKVIAFPSLATT